MLVLISSTGIA